MRAYTYSIDDDTDVEFIYSYDPGEEEVHTESNGDPGTPGSPSTINITRGWVTLESSTPGEMVEVDILPLSDQLDIDLEHIEELIREEHEG